MALGVFASTVVGGKQLTRDNPEIGSGGEPRCGAQAGSLTRAQVQHQKCRAASQRRQPPLIRADRGPTQTVACRRGAPSVDRVIARSGLGKYTGRKNMLGENLFDFHTQN